MKLPKKIYVNWEEGRTPEDGFFNVNTSPEFLEDEAEVGIYVLEKVKKVKVTTELI